MLGVSAATVVEAGDAAGTEIIAGLRRGEQGPEHFLAALARADVAGVEVELERPAQGQRHQRRPASTYPFQRERYSGARPPRGEAHEAGEHPLLQETIEHPGNGMVTLTGRIRCAAHPWLADHAFAGEVLLPGTAFLEVARQAARRVGCETIEELTLQAPLLLPPSEDVRLQVVVEAAGEDGAREIAIYSRGSVADGEEADWSCHAAGLLSPRVPAAAESSPSGHRPVRSRSRSISNT